MKLARFVPAALIALALAVPGLAKDAAVTLDIIGMHCSACADTLQDALKEVKGVKQATVSFDKKEASVTYDSDQVKPEDLLKAVKNAKGMVPFHAKIRK